MHAPTPSERFRAVQSGSERLERDLQNERRTKFRPVLGVYVTHSSLFAPVTCRPGRTHCSRPFTEAIEPRKRAQRCEKAPHVFQRGPRLLWTVPLPFSMALRARDWQRKRIEQHAAPSHSSATVHGNGCNRDHLGFPSRGHAMPSKQLSYWETSTCHVCGPMGPWIPRYLIPVGGPDRLGSRIGFVSRRSRLWMDAPCLLVSV